MIRSWIEGLCLGEFGHGSGRFQVVVEGRCTSCGADLRMPCAVLYSERYDARIGCDSLRVTVIADSFTVSSSARCQRCGEEFPFAEIDLSAGVLSERPQ